VSFVIIAYEAFSRRGVASEIPMTEFIVWLGMVCSRDLGVDSVLKGNLTRLIPVQVFQVAG